MVAYAIVQADVTDAETFSQYAELAGIAVAKFDAKFIVRGGETIVTEGKSRTRTTIVEFADLETAKAYYHSPEYEAARAVLGDAAIRDYKLVDGLS